jgi:serine O-acetyltransferase
MLCGPFFSSNVTIGVHRGKKPIIGDRVKIHAGAVVVGGVTIGDDVIIAPNAFVNFDVPSGKKVFPARSVIV